MKPNDKDTKNANPAAQAPQGQAGDGAQPALQPGPTTPGPGQADLGDAATAQASQPAPPAIGAPSSAQVQASMPPLFKRDRKVVFADTAMRMRNRSEQIGFFRGQRVKPGRTFTLPAGAPIGRWMEPVDPKVADDLAAALEASPKTRGSAGVVLKDRRQRGGSALGPPIETGANRDDGI